MGCSRLKATSRSLFRMVSSVRDAERRTPTWNLALPFQCSCGVAQRYLHADRADYTDQRMRSARYRWNGRWLGVNRRGNRTNITLKVRPSREHYHIDRNVGGRSLVGAVPTAKNSCAGRKVGPGSLRTVTVTSASALFSNRTFDAAEQETLLGRGTGRTLRTCIVRQEDLGTVREPMDYTGHIGAEVCRQVKR